MTRAVVVDRHVFASNASSFNTAWETFGWTPAIAGPRASRLEEQVPWATIAARAEAPPRLSGALADVLAPANFDRLQFSALPLDGRHGFSTWGAIGERRGGEWRVLTHTLLFDDEAFDLMAGFPQGLLTIAAHSGWLGELAALPFVTPVELRPIVLDATRATRAAFERARAAEITRLAALLRGTAGPARLEAELAAIYDALARARGGGPIRHVALRESPDARAALLARLAWTALPIADRTELSFVTEQRKTDAPRATLMVLPDAEWGPYAPPATRLIDPASASAADASPGRRTWAAGVAAGGSDAYGRFGRRLDARRGRVIGRDDVAVLASAHDWRRRWHAADDRAALALELIERESARTGGGARLHAAGHVAARAFAGSADPAAAILEAVRPHRSAAVPILRAAVRTLGRDGEAGRAAALRLRCAAVMEPAAVPVEELFRLFEREAFLLAAARDAAVARSLFRAAAAAGCAGHVQADRLIAAALPALDDPVSELIGIVRAHDVTDPRAARTLAHAAEHVLRLRRDATPAPLVAFAAADHPALLLDAALLDVLLAWYGGQPRADIAALALALLRGLRTTRAADGVLERVLRVLWLERRRGRVSAAERFAAEAGAAALPVFIALMVAPAPLPVFLELRRRARDLAPAARAADLKPWLAGLEAYAPALRDRLVATSAGA